MERSGAPLPGVRITILDHPEFGQTLTRVDGMFDLAVNGGGPLTIDYTMAGYLPAQRQVITPWQDYVRVPDVALIPLDTNVTTIAANAGTMQVHQSTVSTDSDGSRNATLLFPAGTTATMVMADGTTQPLTNFNVRASEYTVGPDGPMAMPGELPPTSGYTYAVESLRSTRRLPPMPPRSRSINRSRPTSKTFSGFRSARMFRVGYYDRKVSAWVASNNGRVIKITAINGGIATVDTVGTGGLPPVVLDNAERETLASLYSVGQELWRMPVTHFTPWDINWGIGPPDDAEHPPRTRSRLSRSRLPGRRAGNSIIGCQNQMLGEAVGVVGTPFGLHYQSDRSPGRKAPTAWTSRSAADSCRASHRGSSSRPTWPAGSSGRAFPRLPISGPPSPGTARTPTAGPSRVSSESSRGSATPMARCTRRRRGSATTGAARSPARKRARR